MKFSATSMVLNLLIILKSTLQIAETAKILAIFPFPGPSQYILVQPYLKALAAKGHELTVINAFPQKESIKNFRDILVMEVHDNYAEIVSSAKSEHGKWEEMTFYSEFFVNITETVIRNNNVQKILRTEKFDLIIMEALHTDAWYALGRHFEAPMIGVSSFGTDPIIDELMGNMSPLAYTPAVTAGLTDRMTFIERLKNVVFTLMELMHVRIHTIPRHKEILKRYLPHIKEDIWDLRTNFSLMLLNQHFTLNFPRPFVPSMVEVGGFQIQYKAKPLPKAINDFIESSTEDVIYFSMGSNIKSKDFPPEKIQMINEVFSSMPYKILWKFEDQTLIGKPKNVFISSWFPQSDVLAHPRVKLFISHGGLLSTTEAVYHGKPVLGLPVFYDQQMNIKKSIQSGFALGLDFHTLPRDEFASKIFELMKNPKYRVSAIATSKIYHDQPVKPLDLAIYWTEYVIRHKGAVHLQNVAQKMNFIQKHSIDTLAVLIAAAFLSIIPLIVITRTIIKLILSKSSINKEKVI